MIGYNRVVSLTDSCFMAKSKRGKHRANVLYNSFLRHAQLKLTDDTGVIFFLPLFNGIGNLCGQMVCLIGKIFNRS